MATFPGSSKAFARSRCGATLGDSTKAMQRGSRLYSSYTSHRWPIFTTQHDVRGLDAVDHAVVADTLQVPDERESSTSW